ncbi:polysaccharide biosynthesis protein [Synechococcus sp. BSF8S]|nr:polysaccharide biosynthesis protein [Synechococcus sp. BSF8S]MBC1264228.1 polysaccharide biosynthesis protein [Synechococcus sp. BSA11S]
MAVDALLIALSFWLSFALRIGQWNSPWFQSNLHLLPWAVGIAWLVLLLSGWYRGLTRYSGSHTLYGLLPRSGLIVLLLLLVSTLSGRADPPFRSFWILFWLLYSGAAIAVRIGLRDLLRLWLARPSLRPMLPARAARDQERGAPVQAVVYGAGQAAAQLLADLRYTSAYRLLAVVDDDPSLWGRRLQGIPIHSPHELPRLIERHGLQQVLLAIPSAPRRRRLELAGQFSALGLAVLTIPSLARIAAGDQQVSELRAVAIEDLLGRETSDPDPALLRAAVGGKVVLVTGAGGSIGSELCRQILRLGPRRLVLLDRSEVALYELEQSLEGFRSQADGPWPHPLAVLGDACNQARLESLCREQAVQVMFHAAAYKHVPLLEQNACAGVANNVLSTRVALEVAFSCGMERFTLISTDKAVRPTNVMGASKRICELLVQAAAQRNGPICSMVRFGNVLGSSGSVVPLFRRQIAAGGPVTVTHPEITRYFMTIPEAVELVLQASGMASGGEVFVLDMGEPVRILDLARQMIRLSGCSICDDDHPEGEIAIRFSGLRPGEKLYEELLIQPTDQPTDHPLIRKAHEQFLPFEQLEPLLAQLQQALDHWDDRMLFQALQALVPEYQPPQASPALADLSGRRTRSDRPGGDGGGAGLPAA